MLEVKRSPANVTWHLCYNDIMVWCGTRRECNDKKIEYKRKYAL